MRLFILMNHTLTEDQRIDALNGLGVSELVTPPAQISSIWCAIPADAETIGDILSPVKAWLDDLARAGDRVLIQGDFGAVVHLVNYAWKKQLVPVYSTTHRAAVETVRGDGSVEITRVFRHKRFRRYEM